MTDSFFEELDSNLKGKVIRRTLMQKIVFKQYPNGDMYIDQTQSKCWFTDTKELVKKKFKLKPKEVKQTIINQREEY